MKRCPKCNRKYEDDTLRFCLEDGVLCRPQRVTLNLHPLRFCRRAGPTLKSLAEPTIPSYSNPPTFALRRRTARPSNPILTAGVVAIALLLLALVGIAAYFVLRQSGGTESAQTNPATTRHQSGQ